MTRFVLLALLCAPGLVRAQSPLLDVGRGVSVEGFSASRPTEDVGVSVLARLSDGLDVGVGVSYQDVTSGLTASGRVGATLPIAATRFGVRAEAFAEATRRSRNGGSLGERVGADVFGFYRVPLSSVLTAYPGLFVRATTADTFTFLVEGEAGVGGRIPVALRVGSRVQATFTAEYGARGFGPGRVGLWVRLQ